MFRHILVPIDFTRKNARSVRVAMDLLAEGRTAITILHVVETIEGIPTSELDGFYRRLAKAAQRKMRPVARRIERAKSAAVHERIVIGNRVAEIVSYATAHHVDLILMGSHKVDPRHPGMEWGTISYRVGILAQCPVLLVK